MRRIAFLAFLVAGCARGNDPGEPAGAGKGRGTGPEDAAEVRETLVQFLRTYARRDAGIDEEAEERTRADCEAWARHVLTGAPPPGAVAAPRSPRGGSATGPR